MFSKVSVLGKKRGHFIYEKVSGKGYLLILENDHMSPPFAHKWRDRGLKRSPGDPLPTKGLVTNYWEGGATKREGGAREVLPLRKGGGGKSFSQSEGGAQKVLGLFLHGSLKF